MKKKKKKAKKVAIRDLKPRKAADVKGGSDRNTDFEEKFVIKKP